MKLKQRWVFVIVLLGLSVWGTKLLAQGQMQKPIVGEYTNQTIFEVLDNIGESEGLQFYYIPDKLPFYRQTFSFDGEELLEVLTTILKGSNLSFTSYGNNAVIIARREQLNKAFAKSLIDKWEDGTYRVPSIDAYKEIKLSFGESQQPALANPTFSGSLIDLQSGEAIVGATFFDEQSGLGGLTDENGQFE
ncbi:MAG: hypothetical protein AAFO94_22560, partial [Bacteroidota bacterium]